MKLSTMILAACALFLGACGGSEEPATAYLDDLATQASALQTSMSTHAKQIAAASDVKAMGPMEQAHMTDMTGHLGHMGQDVGMMGMCTDAQGGMMSTGDMGTLMDQANAECARHENAMMNAADMGAAMMEEDAHQAAMITIMGQMTQMHDQMMNGGMMGGGMMGAADYTCPMMSTP